MPEKYQDEIEEILRGLEETAPKRSGGESDKSRRDVLEPSHPSRRSPRSNLVRGRTWPTVSPGKLAVVGLIVLLLGALWVKLLIWVGLGLLAGAYLLFFVRPRSISYEKRWRGQALENNLSSPWEKFKRWLKS